MVWVGRDLKGHRVPTPPPWAGTLSTRPGCSKIDLLGNLQSVGNALLLGLSPWLPFGEVLKLEAIPLLSSL